MPPYDVKKMNLVPSATPSREEAEEAVRVLIRWAGDDPLREGLVDTPSRVVRAYEEFFAGYGQDSDALLRRVFEKVGGYSDMVMLKDVRVESHCEHHMVPILGSACIAYLPHRRVVGISKLARVIDIFAKRLQTQETMTAQIAESIQSALAPKGVALRVEAVHQCMTTRGVQKQGVGMITTHFTGDFASDAGLRERFLLQAGQLRNT